MENRQRREEKVMELLRPLRLLQHQRTQKSPDTKSVGRRSEGGRYLMEGNLSVGSEISPLAANGCKSLENHLALCPN